MKINLKDIKTQDEDEIRELTSIKSVMKNVGNGKIWSNEKLNNFIKYNLLEQKKPDTKRDNYYYKIVRETSKSKTKSKSNLNSKSSIKNNSKSSSKDIFIGIIGLEDFSLHWDILK